MSCPISYNNMTREIIPNALHIVQGEVTCILTEMKRSLRYPSHTYYHAESPLVNNFVQLRESLYNSNDLAEVETRTFLSPFLEVIRSEETSGHLTAIALNSINKFISYSLIDLSSPSCSLAVENMADAITHARFVGTDAESDEVVLMRILYVLRTLLLSPAGKFLTNESVCEIMQSCFRICFETRLSQLLRRTADQILVEMVQLLFYRLPEFEEDRKWERSSRKLKMRTGGIHPRSSDRSRESSITSDSEQLQNHTEYQGGTSPETSERDNEQSDDLRQSAGSLSGSGDSINIDNTEFGEAQADTGSNSHSSHSHEHMIDIHEGLADIKDAENTATHTTAEGVADESGEANGSQSGEESSEEFTNDKGIKFKQNKEGPPIPYGLPAIRELFRFLISILNPSDKQSSEDMSFMGINLLTVAIEISANHLPKYSSLMSLIKNELSFNLFRQLKTDKLVVFAATVRACFLLFESMRSHLKYQLEMYLTKLMDLLVIVNETPLNSHHDIKEAALQALVGLWRIPGFVSELYINYDCDVHCSNLFEDITKLLSKNAFPVAGLLGTHILSVDALLTVLESVEVHCHSRVQASKQPREPDTKAAHQTWTKPKMKPNRMANPEEMELPSVEILHANKHKKQVLLQGIDMFNQKPKTGIVYLRENGYLDKSCASIVRFLKEIPTLNKAMIGEYISRKDNPELTKTYFESFEFRGKRLDEALRMILESFRLPGESPVIEYLMDIFANLWFDANDSPFANADAGFTLTYAVIMLNVDQHSEKAKKQNIPMKLSEFTRNLQKVNGGEDFDQEMLSQIYHAIKEKEIVLPEEQTGLIRETYLWKVLLGKSQTEDSVFVHVPTGHYDSEIFSIIWGPTIAALSFVFDKSHEQSTSILNKAIFGFDKCAMISAHYGLSEVFDNLVISLCKFTGFLNAAVTPENVPVAFSGNIKAQLAAKSVFSLAHQHGDMLREGWKNILDCLLTLFRARLLPATFTEVTDFLQPDGRIKLIKEDKATDARNDSGMFSLLSSYFGGNESANQKMSSSDEQAALEKSRLLIDECDLDAVIDDTKFMRTSSLLELVKALISLSQFHYNNADSCQDENTLVFFLELLIRVVLQNRDRAGVIWQSVRDHLSYIIHSATDHTFLAERAVSGLLRLAERLLRREEVATQVLPSLKTLLAMKSSVLRSMSRQIAYGLHQLLVQNAANIHSTADWQVLFTLLEVVGAGAHIPHNILLEARAQILEANESIARPDSPTHTDRGYTSDSELYKDHGASSPNPVTSSSSHHNLSVATAPDQSWMLVNRNSSGTGSLEAVNSSDSQSKPSNQFNISLDEKLYPHDTKALMKCADILNLLVRDVAHITPYNFDSCVHATRVFVEASMSNKSNSVPAKPAQPIQTKKKRFGRKESKMARSHTDPSNVGSARHSVSDEENEGEKTIVEYQQLSTQLLELIHTLHTKAASIFHSWAQEAQTDSESAVATDAEVCSDATSRLWQRCWCPLLQAIACLCTDERGSIRQHALTYLQRALLARDLNELSALEWESCFSKVLFPLLTALLKPPTAGSYLNDSLGLDGTRLRASTLLSKVYLQHLHLLQDLPTFAALWLTILNNMQSYMCSDSKGSTELSEGIPETLKNMLLVMSTPEMYLFEDKNGARTQLCGMTCDELNKFLPALRQELFPDTEPVTVTQPLPSQHVPAPVPIPIQMPLPGSAPVPVPVTIPTAAVAQEASPSSEPRVMTSDPLGSPPQPDYPMSGAMSGRPSSPVNVHRPTSPLVEPVTSFSPVIQLHPPLEMKRPQLLPVPDDLPTAASLFPTTNN